MPLLWYYARLPFLWEVYLHFFFFLLFLLSGQCLFSFTAYVPSTPLLIRIRNIARLVVRDASGGDHSFTRDAVELRPDGAKETIQLRGHGELLRVSRRATLLRDSQVCLLHVHVLQSVRVSWESI